MSSRSTEKERLPISAILLAAGESRRMGAFKQLLPLDGRTVVETAVQALVDSRVDEVIVVTGYRGDEVVRALDGYPVAVVHNPDFRLGMASSIKTGMAGISHDSNGVLIALGDQPQIRTATINLILDHFKDRSQIVIPVYGSKRGHPIILGPDLRQPILDMELSRGLREVIEGHQNKVTLVEVTADSILFDLDYPEDYVRLKNSLL